MPYPQRAANALNMRQLASLFETSRHAHPDFCSGMVPCNGITTHNRVLAQALRSQGHSVSVWPQPDAPPAAANLAGFVPASVVEPVLRHVVGRLAPIWCCQPLLSRHVWPSGCGRLWVFLVCLHASGHVPRRMKVAIVVYTIAVAWSPVDPCSACNSALADGMERRVPVCLSRLPLDIPVGGFVTA